MAAAAPAISKGMRFGEWTVVDSTSKLNHSAIRSVLARCSHTEKLVPIRDLLRGLSTGCRECRNGKFRTTTDEERILLNRCRHAKRRCRNVRNPAYHHYGGRGIEFRFSSIREMAVYVRTLPGFGPGMTVDRINNDGHYEPGNLRWATKTEQARNRRAARR